MIPSIVRSIRELANAANYFNNFVCKHAGVHAKMHEEFCRLSGALERAINSADSIADTIEAQQVPSEPKCEWAGVSQGLHQYVDTADGGKRCIKCKHEIAPRAQQVPAQEPICYLRTLNGKPDWAEDCISSSTDALLDQYAEEDGYSAIPLYASPQPESAKWLPIESAPKKREVLVGRWIDGEFRFCQAGLYFDAGNEFEGEPPGWCWSSDWDKDGVTDDEGPTHWTELIPPPPEQT